MEALPSFIDGKPILTLESVSSSPGKTGKSSYRTYAENVLKNVATKGDQIAAAIARGRHNLAAVKDVTDDFSTHLSLQYGEEYREVLLTLQPGPTSEAAPAKSGVTVDNAYLVLDPDVFLITEDEDGNELWPVTTSAISLQDPGKSIEVTFLGDGEIETSAGDVELVYLTHVPVIRKQSAQDEGIAAPASASKTNGQASLASTTVHYLALKMIRLEATGDGSGEAELLWHQDWNDNYSAQFSRIWDHRYDVIYSCVSVVVPCSYNAINQAATGVYDAYGNFRPDYYEVPDVNEKNKDYDFVNMDKWQWGPNSAWNHLGPVGDYFPLFALDASLYRAVMTEDDDRYPEFSRRRASSWSGNVETYDMSTGGWSNVYTKLNANYEYHGSSDEVILESGMRRASLSNVNLRSGNGAYDIYAVNNGFEYRFRRLTVQYN